MSQAVMSVRLDAQDKSEFSRFCDEVGMTASTAVNMFVKQTLALGKIPFEIVRHAPAGRAQEALSVQEVAEGVSAAASAFPGISRVILFGSHARGEAGPASDIDLRIEYDEDGSFSIMNLAAFCDSVEHATGREVDAVTARVVSNPVLAAAIERDGVVVYERPEI